MEDRTIRSGCNFGCKSPGWRDCRSLFRVMLYCICDSMDRYFNVCELLLRLYANRESCQTGFSAVQVSFISFLLIFERISTAIFLLELLFSFPLCCSSECENSREKALCSFPEANLSLSTGERVSIYLKSINNP